MALFGNRRLPLICLFARAGDHCSRPALLFERTTVPCRPLAAFRGKIPISVAAEGAAAGLKGIASLPTQLVRSLAGNYSGPARGNSRRPHWYTPAWRRVATGRGRRPGGNPRSGAALRSKAGGFDQRACARKDKDESRLLPPGQTSPASAQGQP